MQQEQAATQPGQATPTPENSSAAPQAQTPPAENNNSPAGEQKQEGAEQKPKADANAPKEKVVPEKYELNIPEGAQITQAALKRIEDQAKEKGLSLEEAQAMVDSENAAVSGYLNDHKENFAKLADSWRETVQADPELGGDNYKETVANANAVIERYGSPEFKKILDATRWGDNPEVVRVFARIGKAMAPGKFVPPTSPAAPEQEHAQVLFPMNQQQGV